MLSTWMQSFGESNYETTSWHSLEFILVYLKWPHQPIITRIITMWFVSIVGNDLKKRWKILKL
jgi:hypothetical protein